MLSTFCVFPGQLVFIVYILCFSRPTCVYSVYIVFPGQLACLLSVYILCFSRPTCVYSLSTFCVFPLGSPLNIIIVTISVMQD